MNLKRLSPGESALVTIAYADIFDYPLTRKELHTWSILSSSVSVHANKITQKDGFVFLKGRSDILRIRKARQQWQEEKWSIARRVAGWLVFSPTILLVGVTGGLSMNNAKKEDDIDFFLVVAGGTIWITRFFITVWMDILGLRRKPLTTAFANKVCFNMFVTKRGLSVPENERDCFSAHEVLQMKPLWEQKGVYKNFLDANSWARTFLPNAWSAKSDETVPNMSVTPCPVIWLFRLFEFPFKLFQLVYMQQKRTHEVITDSVLRFHPEDARVWVKKKFARHLGRYKIPLDKIFYAR